MLDRFYSFILARMKSEEGATAVEYGLIVAAIAVAIVVVVGTLGDKVAAAFTTIANAM
jgi:pilus assembly protein Flp/PilA